MLRGSNPSAQKRRGVKDSGKPRKKRTRVKRQITTEKWSSRQAVLSLRNNKWKVSFLATHQGSISETGAEVGNVETTLVIEASTWMASWIVTGMVPDHFTTHVPHWFKRVE